MSAAVRPSAGEPSAVGRADDIRIDRLALRVAGLDEDAAHTLARLVAIRLSPGTLRPAGLNGLDSVQVEVRASAAEQSRPDLLARRIADEVGWALAGDQPSAAPGGEAVS